MNMINKLSAVLNYVVNMLRKLSFSKESTKESKRAIFDKDVARVLFSINLK